MRIEEQVVIGASPARVWTVIADPLALSAIEPGVLIEPDGADIAPGLRARYRAMLRVGPVPAGGEVEIVEYVEGRELAWASLTGIDQRFRLRVRDEDAGRTRLTLRFGYSSPGALGWVADLVAYGQVRDLMRSLLAGVRKEAERRPRRQGK